MKNYEPQVEVKPSALSIEISWGKLIACAIAGIFLIGGPLTTAFWSMSDHHNDGLYGTKAEVLTLGERVGSLSTLAERNAQRLDDIDKSLKR